MGRRAKPAKVKTKAARPLVRKAQTQGAARVLELEKRLAESLGREKAKDRALTEALDQQTATSEILQVISSSPTHLQPVFEAIVRNATRLCGGRFGTVHRFDGQLIHLAAHYHLTADAVEAMHQIYPLSPDRPGSRVAHAIRQGRIVHVGDAQADESPTGDVFALASRMARILGYHSQIVVPMLREGLPIGALSIAREEVGLFPEVQVELLKTFADQAVIAIENVRLFTELQTGNRELTTALDQQTATSNIWRVISRSQTDVQPVFDTIADSAQPLCGAAHRNGVVFDAALVLLPAVAGA